MEIEVSKFEESDKELMSYSLASIEKIYISFVLIGGFCYFMGWLY